MFHQLSKIRLRLWDKFWYVSLCHCTFMQYRSNSFANLNCLRMYNHVVSLSHTSASRTKVSMYGITDQVEFASAVITKKQTINFSSNFSLFLRAPQYRLESRTHAGGIFAALLTCCVRFTPECIGNVALQDQLGTRISDSRRRRQENWSSSLKWQPNGGFKK